MRNKSYRAKFVVKNHVIPNIDQLVEVQLKLHGIDLLLSRELGRRVAKQLPDEIKHAITN